MIPPVDAATGQSPSVTSTVKQMAGMLWYNLLSEMNKNGIGAGALGDGGDAYNSMFLWNIAQTDFSKYDDALTSATVQQLNGRAAMPPAVQPIAVVDGAYAASPIVAVSAVDLPALNDAVPDADLTARATKFAKAVWPQIQAAAASLGVPAQAVLAQSALETGWGAAVPGNNLFGMKAAAGQAGTARATEEMVNAVLTPQTAMFRDYGSTAASVADYVGHIRIRFSNAAGAPTVAGFANALQVSGYATDSHYASKIIAISKSPVMAQVLHAVGKIP